MQKEKHTPISKNPDTVRELESTRYIFRKQQEDGVENYEWFEDAVIRKIASVYFAKNTLGKDTATIKLIDPKTKEKKTVYFTADETEVSRLKDISEGRGIILEVED